MAEVREGDHLVSDVTDNFSSRTGRRPPRNRIMLFGFVAWSALVIAALWWLLHAGAQGSGPGSWVVHEGDATKAFVQRAQDWLWLAHLNFQRIYPWILFAPYIAWLAWTFSLERGRLRWSLPVHVLACGIFAFATYEINSHANNSVARVVIINSHRQSDAPPGSQVTATVQVNVSGDMRFGAVQEQSEEKITGGKSFTNSAQGKKIGIQGELSDSGLTNLFSELEQAIKHPPALRMPLKPLSTLLDLLAYGALVGLVHSVHFYRRFRERERRALFLESNLAKARLEALQAQLQPHFLFNTLNAIATLLRRDPRAAEATLTSLSELLRLTLSRAECQEMTVREESEFLQRYVEIQQTRFGDRLHFEQNIEPAALDCLTPTLLLQPLVENAIRHGIEPLDRAGLVRVSASRRNGVLVICVEDNGVGLDHGAGGNAGAWMVGQKPGSGIGLMNLRARLEALYGAEQRLELSSRPEGGVVVRVEIPCRLAKAEHANELTAR